MNQQQFLDLIQASQTTLKHELMTKHPESKYQLLMLSRSFELVKQYLIQQNQHQKLTADALQNYFQLPISSLEEGLTHLCEDLRQQHQTHALETLQRLNQADLRITNPKAVKHG